MKFGLGVLVMLIEKYNFQNMRRESSVAWRAAVIFFLRPLPGFPSPKDEDAARALPHTNPRFSHLADERYRPLAGRIERGVSAVFARSRTSVPPQIGQRRSLPKAFRDHRHD